MAPPPPPAGSPAGEIRGMLGPDGDSPSWLSATSPFPNGVPRFPDKESATRWMIDYAAGHPGSNPDDPTLKHQFTLLTDWPQIERHLLPHIERVRALPPLPAPRAARANAFEAAEAAAVLGEVRYRLDLPVHRSTNPVSTGNTLR